MAGTDNLAESRPTQSVVYIDSPLPNAVHQVMPFMSEGLFSGGGASLVVKDRPRRSSLWRDLLRKRQRPDDVARVKVADWAPTLPENTVVYYPFNAHANMVLVSYLKLKHVLILHGESNKVSSYRPASRLYDYIVVAGDLGCRRYLRAKVFTQAELDGGRLIRMGDSFVQSYSYLKAAPDDADGCVLYAPTWETATKAENYSSAENGFGFDLASDCAKSLGKNYVLVKLHPNYGTRDTTYLDHLVSGLKRMTANGLIAKVADDVMSANVRSRLKTVFGPDIFASTKEIIPVSFAVSDVSGMEAVFLKQNIAHMVVTKNNFEAMPEDPDLDTIYKAKTFAFEECRTKALGKLNNYFRQNAEIDREHRDLVFSYSDPSVAAMTPSERFEWLENYIRRDPYWT